MLAQLDFFEGHWHCLLNMERGMLVLHPDVLLSGALCRAVLELAGARRSPASLVRAESSLA